MGKHLHNELERLKEKLLSLSTTVEESVYNAVKSVQENNREAAKKVIRSDTAIDEVEVEVEEECLKILALHQPVAIDLRFVISVLKINNDLERIGDLAVNIAQRELYLGKLESIDIPFDFETMARKTRKMLKNALDSLIQMNAPLANEVCQADKEVDAIHRDMYDQVFSEIKKRPEHTEALIQYLSISRHVERIADYATNIAEDVIYMIDGQIVRHQPDFGYSIEEEESD